MTGEEEQDRYREQMRKQKNKIANNLDSKEAPVYRKRERGRENRYNAKAGSLMTVNRRK